MTKRATPLLAAFMAKGELNFLAEAHATQQPDAWGWTVHVIGPYRLRTNGVAWLGSKIDTGRMCLLKTIMTEATKAEA